MRVLATSLIAAVAVLAVACGDSDDSADTVPTREPTTATSETPNETPSATQTEAEATSTPEPTPEPEATEPAPIPSDEELEKALLSLDDMPSGWSPSPAEEADDPDDASEFCPDATEPEDPGVDAVGEATVDYQQSEFGPFFTQLVYRFEGNGAEQGMDAFRVAVSACDEWTEVDPDMDAEIHYSIQPL